MRNWVTVSPGNIKIHRSLMLKYSVINMLSLTNASCNGRQMKEEGYEVEHNGYCITGAII